MLFSAALHWGLTHTHTDRECNNWWA